MSKWGHRSGRGRPRVDTKSMTHLFTGQGKSLFRVPISSDIHGSQSDAANPRWTPQSHGRTPDNAGANRGYCCPARNAESGRSAATGRGRAWHVSGPTASTAASMIPHPPPRGARSPANLSSPRYRRRSRYCKRPPAVALCPPSRGRDRSMEMFRLESSHRCQLPHRPRRCRQAMPRHHWSSSGTAAVV